MNILSSILIGESSADRKPAIVIGNCRPVGDQLNCFSLCSRSYLIADLAKKNLSSWQEFVASKFFAKFSLSWTI